MKKQIIILCLFFASVLTHVHLFADDHDNKTLKIYSYRSPDLIQFLLDDFQKKTGIKVEVIFSKKGLTERIIQEGKNVQADVLLDVGVAKFYQLERKRLLKKIQKSVFYKVPFTLRSKRKYWTGLTTRARLLYVSNRLPKNAINSYEDMTLPKWKGKICIRSGYNSYNLALFSNILAHHGYNKTKTWLTKLKNNLSRKPQGNDRAQAKAIKEGICDIGIGNSYYYGKMLYNEKEPQQKQWAKAINLVFPNQSQNGTHVNISGIAILRYAKNPKAAQQLVQFLLNSQSQKKYAMLNYEFPVMPEQKDNLKLYQIFPKSFKYDPVPLYRIAQQIPRVMQILDSIQFDS